MLNRWASLVMSTSILEDLPGKLDIRRHSPSILYYKLGDFSCFLLSSVDFFQNQLFGKIISGIPLSNSLDPDQARCMFPA